MEKIKEAKIGDKIKGFWSKVTKKKQPEEATAEVEDLEESESKYSIIDNSSHQN